MQPVSNVHPDAAPFTNVPDVRETNTNINEQSSLGGYDGTIQQQQARMGPAQAPGPVSGVGPEERYNSRGDGMGGSAVSDNMVSPTMSTQGTSGNREMRGGEVEMSGPAAQTTDVSLHMPGSTGAYASQGVTNMSPGAEKAVPAGASSVMPQGGVRNLGGTPGFPSPVQTASQDGTGASQGNVGSLAAGTMGAPRANIVGTNSMRQDTLAQPLESADLSSAYTSRTAEPAAALNGQFQGQEGPRSQYGAMVDDSGMQNHSPGLGVSGAIAGNVGNGAYAVRAMPEGPRVVGRLMVG